MAINKDTVKYVANLAKVKLDDEQLILFSHQLEEIVNFIDKLKKLDVTEIKPTSHILPVKNVFREDKPTESLTSKEALSNAPVQKENLFIVPRVIE